jgi:glucose-1-phosphate cytidylyltransferase
MIKEYFANYRIHHSDSTYFTDKSLAIHHKDTENWQVTCVDTGADSMTGGRIKRIEKYLDKNEKFLLTYGDGVGNIDIDATLDTSDDVDVLITMTAARSTARFGVLTFEGDWVTSFAEKPIEDAPFVNAGYFVCSPLLLSLIDDDKCILEKDILPMLAEKRLMKVYKHEGFWMPMDSLHDKVELEKIYKEKGNIYGE